MQLTRDPRALSDALGELGNGGGLLSGSSVPMYPAHDKRLRALARMGATVVLSPPPRMPLWLRLVIAVAGVVVVSLMSIVVYLLVMISIAFSGLFTLLPTVILHALLR